MLKAAIFDMDGLLIDSEPLWWIAESEVFNSLGIPLQPEDCRQTVGLRSDMVVDYWYQRFPWQGTDKALVEKRIIERVIELIQLKGEPKAGVAHALAYCARQDAKLALATSSSYPIIEAVIDKLHLHDVFQVLYSAEEEPYAKPHPGVYITAAHKLGVSPEECVALEDSFIGILAAKSARMRSIAVPEPYARHDPRFVISDVVLHSLAELNDGVWQALSQQV